MHTSKYLFTILLFTFCNVIFAEKADSRKVIERNNPRISKFDTSKALSVGNGTFQFTTDVTGLQSFPKLYTNSITLETQSDWGLHHFPKKKDSAPENSISPPHRLHLGNIGFANMSPEELTDINQVLDLWDGKIISQFKYQGKNVKVETNCHPDKDMIIANIKSSTPLPLLLRFAYPTGNANNACDWDKDSLHKSTIIYADNHKALLRRDIDETIYHIFISYTDATLTHNGKNQFLITPKKSSWTINIEFSIPIIENKEIYAINSDYWHDFWKNKSFTVHTSENREFELGQNELLSIYLKAIGQSKE